MNKCTQCNTEGMFISGRLRMPCSYCLTGKLISELKTADEENTQLQAKIDEANQLPASLSPYKALEAENKQIKYECKDLKRWFGDMARENKAKDIIIKDLAMLIRRLCKEGDLMVEAKAMDYLRRKNLMGSVLRNSPQAQTES